jgi:CheY-like chemotaxis protein
VLVVDDEIDFASALTARLSNRGFDAHFVSSGEDALQTLSERPCDVVVLDLKMPGMGGLEALRRIRSGYPDIKIIVLTGHGQVDSGIEGLRAGAVGAEHLVRGAGEPAREGYGRLVPARRPRGQGARAGTRPRVWGCGRQ